MAAKYLHYTYDQLNTFCMDAFQKFGFSESEARIISDVLLLSDLYGIESHGMQRLVRYHKGIEKGMIDVHAKPEIVHETPVSAVIDAHDAMGQLVSHQAMELAIEKAKKTGMAIVSVRNSNHFGIAGYYAKMAVAWAVSVYFVKFPDQVMEYLKQSSLDDWTYNKALQKITESFRVDKETKKLVRQMRRGR